jgi:AcrR family transcriptional regulator
MTSGHTEKERVYEFARKEFLLHGFARISVDALTNGLGMSKKTFYKHFSSKEELVQLMANRMIESISGPMDAIVHSNDNFIDKLNRLLTHLAGNVSVINSSFARDLQRYEPRIWSKVEEFRRRRVTDVFSRIFSQGIREGHMRRGINQQILLSAYLAAIERVIQPGFLAEVPYSATEALHQLVGIFFTGILTPEATKKLTRSRNTSFHNH